MKLLFRFWVVAALLFIVGCSKEYDDSALVGRVDDLESRVQRLEQLCLQMNTNISSLQTIVTALQNNDYVTGVTPITENGKTIGYTITFAKAQSITIHHGKDGQDGITPQLKIEDDYWYVSYDNGSSWTQLGKATGEDGKDGDSFFQSVTQDESNVYFTHADGTVITLPKGLALSIEFAASDLVVMSPNSTCEITYTVTIHITTGVAIDEYSKMIVFVSNGDKVIMRSITFEEAGLVVEENATKQVASEGGDATTFAQLLHHETCGHGFAKLADEYAYETMGAAPSDYVSEIQTQQADWGWWKNVDFTSDPTATHWSHFINDTRYANEGLGAYEGAATYWTGVW